MKQCLSAILAIASLSFFAGCGSSSDKGVSYKNTNVVFDVAFVEFLSDGRPVIEIKPNGKSRPSGSGPYGDYYLILRPDSSTPYVRQFDTAAAEKGVKRDFMINKSNLASFKRVTVSVENPEGGKFDNPVLLSNVIELPVH